LHINDNNPNKIGVLESWYFLWEAQRISTVRVTRKKSERGNRDSLYTVSRENGHDVKTYQKEGSQAYTRLKVQTTTYDQSIINRGLENLMIL